MIFVACKNNTVKISGTLVTPVSGEYIYLDELKSNELKTVDSVLVTNNGVFKFKKDVKFPSFYLLTKNNNNFYYAGKASRENHA